MLISELKSLMKVLAYSSIDTRNRNERTWRSTSTVDNVQLCTADVELGTTIAGSGVESDLIKYEMSDWLKK